MIYAIIIGACIIATSISLSAKLIDLKLHQIQVMLNHHIQDYFIREDGKSVQ